MERLFPQFERIETEDIYRDLRFPEPPPGRPYIAINMVTSVDGKATNLAGTVTSLGSRVDRTAMRRIRAAADGVMNGAETLRRENVNPTVPDAFVAARISNGLAPQPAAITITASCNLPLDGTFFRAQGLERVVVTTSHAPAERMEELSRHARILVAGEYLVDFTMMMRALRHEYSIRWLVVEGGPTVNSELIAKGMADELFWTISPKVLGGPAQRTMVEESPLQPEERPGLELLSLYSHESELYVRYGFVRPA